MFSSGRGLPNLLANGEMLAATEVCMSTSSLLRPNSTMRERFACSISSRSLGELWDSDGGGHDDV